MSSQNKTCLKIKVYKKKTTIETYWTWKLKFSPSEWANQIPQHKLVKLLRKRWLVRSHPVNKIYKHDNQQEIIPIGASQDGSAPSHYWLNWLNWSLRTDLVSLLPASGASVHVDGVLDVTSLHVQLLCHLQAGGAHDKHVVVSRDKKKKNLAKTHELLISKFTGCAYCRIQGTDVLKAS